MLGNNTFRGFPLLRNKEKMITLQKDEQRSQMEDMVDFG
jgi:hypothetical protein